MIKQTKIIGNIIVLLRLKINSIILIILIAVFICFSSCKEIDGLGEYYEGNFNDLITIISKSDTVNIVIEQLRWMFLIKENIPYSEEINNTNTDSINLKLFVSFGSYSQTPEIIKEINEIMDTFYVWYSTKNKIKKTLFKNNSITAVTTTPRIEYVSIDSIVVQRAQNKFIYLINKFVEYHSK